MNLQVNGNQADWNSIVKKQVLVTGSASGIGLATAQLLFDSGWDVIGIDMVDADVPWQHICSKVTPEVFAGLKLDNLQGVFCNAGVHVTGLLKDASDLEVNSILELNLKSVIWTLQFALKNMTKGAIVINASEQVNFAKPENALYGMTKAAIAHLARSTAVDSHPIRCNAILPGSTDTPLIAKTKAKLEQQFGKEFDMSGRAIGGRLANSNEIAQVVKFLLSEESSFINGALVPIDDGASAS